MSEHLYQVIYNDLLRKITTGEFAPNEKLPTEHELMSFYGVSRVTAITALNHLRDDGYITRSPRIGSVVRGAGTNGAPRGDIQFVTVWDNDSIPGMYEAIRERASDAGYGTVMYNSHHSVEAEREYLRSMLSRRVAGVICYPLNGEFGNISAFAQLRASGVPLITVDKRVWIPDGDIPCVTTDNRRAAYDMTSWLIEEMGHRRIAYCCARFDQANARYRFKGYVGALISHGIEYDPALTDELESPSKPYRAHRSDFTEYLNYLMGLAEPPTAVVCECDYVAISLMKSAKELGVRVPERLSIVGFDNIDMSGMLEVPLTTMEQDFTGIGAAAAERLLALMDGGKVEPLTLFGTKLIERASVRKLD